MAPTYSQGVDADKYPVYNPGIDNKAAYQKRELDDLKFFATTFTLVVVAVLVIYFVGSSVSKLFKNKNSFIEEQRAGLKSNSVTKEKLEQLNALHELYKNGAISEPEYEDLKSRIL